MRNFSKSATVGATALALLMPVIVLAVSLPNPTPPGSSGQAIDLRYIEFIIQRIAEFLIVFGVVIAVIMIIWGGISWILAGGNDERLKTAKKRVWNGVIGAAIVLGVGVILQTIARILNKGFFN